MVSSLVANRHIFSHNRRYTRHQRKQSAFSCIARNALLVLEVVVCCPSHSLRPLPIMHERRHTGHQLSSLIGDVFPQTPFDSRSR